MRNERKVAYQSEQIKKLEAQVKFLAQENKALVRENESKREIITAMETNNQQMQKLHDEILEEYKQGMREVENLKAEYKLRIKAAKTLEKEFENKMKDLLAKLRSQTT